LLAELPAKSSMTTLQIPIGLRDRDRCPAVLDTEADGQHIAIAGAPRSGRSTTLRTLILSLAACYSPAQLRIAIFDPTRKLASSANALTTLPHVHQHRVLDDPSELLPLLRAQEQRWRDSGGAQRLAVLIDSFDEFSEDLHANRQINDEEKRSLVTLAKRAGDHGITLIVAFGLRTISNDLYKAVRDSAQGVGLRSEESIGFLNALGRSDQRLLPVGRGTLVLRKVRGAALQIAIAGSGQDADYAALAQQIVARDPQAAPSDADAAALPAALPLDPAATEQMALLRRGLRHLLDALIQQTQPLDHAEIQQLLRNYHALPNTPDAEQRERLLRQIGFLTDPDWIKLDTSLRESFGQDTAKKWLNGSIPMQIIIDLLNKQLQP
jgi:hypothetical protein